MKPSRSILVAPIVAAMLASREDVNIRHREVAERKPSGKDRAKVKAARKQRRRQTKRSKK